VARDGGGAHRGRVRIHLVRLKILVAGRSVGRSHRRSPRVAPRFSHGVVAADGAESIASSEPKRTPHRRSWWSLTLMNPTFGRREPNRAPFGGCALVDERSGPSAQPTPEAGKIGGCSRPSESRTPSNNVGTEFRAAPPLPH